MRSRVLLMVVVLLAVITGNAEADTKRLYWTPPTEYTNGTPLTDLAGYNVYWGTSSRNYPNRTTVLTCMACPEPVGSEEELTCLPLIPGQTYYIAVTAFNSSGVESAYSNELVIAIPSISGTLGNIDTTSPGSATRVDGYDLIMMMKCFGTGITGLSCTDANFTSWKNSCEPADLNYTGNVDGSDFGILNTNFGK